MARAVALEQADRREAYSLRLGRCHELVRRFLPWSLLVCLYATPGIAAQYEGHVIKVVDGDTFDVRLNNGKVLRVRLGAIDAPELAQPFGRRAGTALRHLAVRRPVTIETSKRDSHGRAVAQAWIASTGSCPRAHCDHDLDLALAQLETGMAWYYKHFANEQPAALRARYAAAERQARTQQRGLWRGPHPLPPWEWRHRPQNGRTGVSIKE